MLFVRRARHYAGPRGFLENQCQPYTSTLHSNCCRDDLTGHKEKGQPKRQPPQSEGLAVQQHQDLFLIYPFPRPAQVLKKLCVESKRQVTGLTKPV